MLRDAGAEISAELIEYEQQRQRVHAYVERLKQTISAQPLMPIPVRQGVTLYNHQIKAYNIALALFGYALSGGDVHEHV